MLAAPFNPTFNPGQVAWNQPQRTSAQSPSTPYVSMLGASQGGTTQPGTSTTIGGQSIGASGNGPFDQAYRQNLAVYSMGQFARPNAGNYSFNPTGPLNFGQSIVGGNAPTLGMPMTLLGAAQGGNPFYYQPPDDTGTGGQ